MVWFLYDRDLRHERVNSSTGGKMLNEVYMTFCAIWYNLYNLRVDDACNFAESNTPPWVKLCKWCQIVQIITDLIDQYNLTNFLGFVMEGMIFQDALPLIH